MKFKKTAIISLVTFILLIFCFFYTKDLPKGYVKKILIEVPINPENLISGLGTVSLASQFSSIPSSILGFYTEETDFSQQVYDYALFSLLGDVSIAEKIMNKLLFTGAGVKGIEISDSRKFLLITFNFSDRKEYEEIQNKLLNHFNQWYQLKKDLVKKQVESERAFYLKNLEKVNTELEKLGGVRRSIGSNPLVLAEIQKINDVKSILETANNKIDKIKTILEVSNFEIASVKKFRPDEDTPRPSNKVLIIVLVGLFVAVFMTSLLIFEFNTDESDR